MGFSEVFNLFVQIIGRWVSLLMSGLSLDSPGKNELMD